MDWWSGAYTGCELSLIHISEPTRLGMISYAVFCLKKKITKPPLVPPPNSHEKIEGEKKLQDSSYDDRPWNYWIMSQRSGSISYLTFGAGLSMALYGLFFVLADMIGLKIG